MKLKDWLTEWLNLFIKPSVKERTFYRYKIAIENNILPTLGGMELSEIDGMTLQHFVGDLLECGGKSGEGLSYNSINIILSILKSSFSLACAQGLISENPMTGVKRPKKEEKGVSCFTASEQRKIERVILRKRGNTIGILISLYTGLRLGELLALEWSDIDFASGILTVSKTCYDAKNEDNHFGRITYSPKTTSSRRIIPLPKMLIRELREHKRKAKTKWVIEGRGGPVATRSYQRTFSTLLRNLHLPHKCFHSLRHTFATRALECGMDVRTLAEILGHKNPGITLSRYAHSLMEHKAAMMNRLGRLLF